MLFPVQIHKLYQLWKSTQKLLLVVNCSSLHPTTLLPPNSEAAEEDEMKTPHELRILPSCSSEDELLKLHFQQLSEKFEPN